MSAAMGRPQVYWLTNMTVADIRNDAKPITRLDVTSALHHISVRGIERCRIFLGDTDRDKFLTLLGDLLNQNHTPCYAWALLPNPAHLLPRTGFVPLATVKRRMLTGYGVRFNHSHWRHGYLFQNRCQSFLCQEDPYLLELVRYIFLNPVQARLVGDLRDAEIRMKGDV